MKRRAEASTFKAPEFMNPARKCCCALLLLSGTVPPLISAAADYSGYLVLTTDYVFRGVTYSDGHAAAQLGGDVVLDSGIYFGAWASTIDIDNGPSRQRDVEVNYYLGYSHDLEGRWSLGANVVAYTYPATSGSVDYDYIEYSAVANYADRVWFEYSFSPDLYHTGYESHDVNVYSEWPIQASWNIGAGAGYYDVSKLSGDGYAYWQLGLSRQFGRFDLDLRYHDTDRWVPIVSNAERAAARIALSAKFSF